MHDSHPLIHIRSQVDFIFPQVVDHSPFDIYFLVVASCLVFATWIFSKDLLRRLDPSRCSACPNHLNLMSLITATISGSLFIFSNYPLVFLKHIHRYFSYLPFQPTREFLFFWSIPNLQLNIKVQVQLLICSTLIWWLWTKIGT